MMICSYCQTKNENNVEKCCFCEAPLKIERPKLKDMVFVEQAEQPFHVLVTYHTYDLLVLLRMVREERTKSYDLMRTLQKAPEEVMVDSNTLDFAEQEYRRYTARMKLIEGILIDRMGYKPKRVDNKLLESLRAKIERNIQDEGKRASRFVERM